jgi:hypothetical protein
MPGKFGRRAWEQLTLLNLRDIAHPDPGHIAKLVQTS